MDIIFQEEQKMLAEIESKLDAIASRYENSARKLQADISDFWVIDREDLSNKQYLLSQRGLDRERAQKFRSYQPSPYFGRLDLSAEDSDETNTYYIGQEGITYLGENMVVDWRAPIGNCYYMANQKEFRIDRVKHYLALKRALNIKDAILLSYKTEYDSATASLEGDVIDPFLLTVLEDKRRQNRLTHIIRTIQANQNEIIRKDRSESFVVQGCAGSGKTMILLHRLSYLKFNHKDMVLGTVKIITPNKFFNAHINDLSIELGLDAIERYSVEEYYVALIKKYSGKVAAVSEVNSEKTLNSNLMGAVYSLAYMKEALAHYHGYWKQILTELDEEKLRHYFQRFSLEYPNTSIHKSSTASQLELGIHQISATISEYEEKKENIIQRLRVFSQEIETVQKELDRNKELLLKEKAQTINKLEQEFENIEKNIQDRDSQLAELKTVYTKLQINRSQAEADLTQATDFLKGFIYNSNTYSDYERFIFLKDRVSLLIREVHANLIQEITNSEQVYQKTPIYNFTKRNNLRKLISQRKEQFSHTVSAFITEQISNSKAKASELDTKIERINSDISRVQETIQKAEQIINNLKTKSTALAECLRLFNTDEHPDTQNRLTLSNHKALEQILAVYENQRTIFIRISNRLISLAKTKNNLMLENEQLVKNVYSATDKEYISVCNSIVKKLQLAEVMRNVMQKDLLLLYKQYKQKYQKTNYRHKIYLKLLYCCLYFPRLASPDTFLNIDEAQDISSVEYRLLRMVLGDSCIFNLYGDINQSVYSYKGITDWEEISNITAGNVNVLNENYRNTLQITNFCNKEFDAEFYPIGISGEPVLETTTIEAINWILSFKKNNPNSRVAIIHRHGLKAVQEHLNFLLTGQLVSWYVVNDNQLSILSVEKAKGLEFEAVVAIVDQMSDNEKYISYTRALDRLVVVRDKYSSNLESDDIDDGFDDGFE